MLRLLSLFALLALPPTVFSETTIQLPNNPTVSPRGKRVAFSWDGDLWDVKLRGGVARKLTVHNADDRSPVYSRDGKQIAFISNRSGSNQVYVMPARGGEPRRVTSHSEGYLVHDWFPDGRSLLCTGQRDHHWRDASRLIRVWVDGSRGELVLADAAAKSPSLSPDGRSVLFNREGKYWWRKGYRGSRAAQVWLLQLETGHFRELLHEGVDCFWPVWSRDGGSFYFCKGGREGFDLWRAEIPDDLREGDPQGAGGVESRCVVDVDTHSIVFPSSSTGSSEIVYRHGFALFHWNPETGAAPQEIKVRTRHAADLPEDLARRKLEQAEEVAFHPDGLEIAIIAGGDVWVMDTELREPVQVTKTPEYETDLTWGPEGKSLWFVSTRDAQADIFRTERGDDQQYWWMNTEFTTTRVTNDAESESRLRFDPAGKRLFYVRGNGQLWSLDTDSKEAKQHVEGFSPPDYDVSQDGRWLAYALEDDEFNSDVYLSRVDGSQPPYNVSRHPDNDTSPRFSNDGKVLAFTGRRIEQETDIFYVYLQNELDDQSRRDRKLEDALKKMQEKRDKPEKETPRETTQGPGEEGESQQETDPEEEEQAATCIEIDLDGIEERVRQIGLPNVNERNLVWVGDAQQLAFTASIKGKRGYYSLQLPDELEPDFLTSKTGSGANWSKEAKALFINSGGKPTKVDLKGDTESYGFSVVQEYSRSERFAHAFDVAWRTMRDRWYDDRLGGKNWDQIRRRYRPMAAGSIDPLMFESVIRMMLGELNGSHLGFYPRDAKRYDPPPHPDRTAHLGLRFDPGHKGPGLRVRDVLPDSPSDREGANIDPGDLLIEIDGKKVDPAMDLAIVLNGLSQRDIRLKVKKVNEEEVVEVVVRPGSYAAARGWLYKKWMIDTRDKVNDLSDRKLGYLHIRSMNTESFNEFERQLYVAGQGKDGMIIDVRDNGGGWTTDYLLTALTQPRHAITVPRGGGRGYPQGRRVFACWQKPIVVLCNQNSFSNAEIFSHAIKTLGRGTLVGVPTAGGVISTGSVEITDVGRLRMPFRGWFVLGSGQDMELNGAIPDVVLWPEPGEIPSGVDSQLERAVELLRQDVGRQSSGPPLEYAVERTATD